MVLGLELWDLATKMKARIPVGLFLGILGDLGGGFKVLVGMLGHDFLDSCITYRRSCIPEKHAKACKSHQKHSKAIKNIDNQ